MNEWELRIMLNYIFGSSWLATKISIHITKQDDLDVGNLWPETNGLYLEHGRECSFVYKFSTSYSMELVLMYTTYIHTYI